MGEYECRGSSSYHWHIGEELAHGSCNSVWGVTNVGEHWVAIGIDCMKKLILYGDSLGNTNLDLSKANSDLLNVLTWWIQTHTKHLYYMNQSYFIKNPGAECIEADRKQMRMEWMAGKKERDVKEKYRQERLTVKKQIKVAECQCNAHAKKVAEDVAAGIHDNSGKLKGKIVTPTSQLQMTSGSINVVEASCPHCVFKEDLQPDNSQSIGRPRKLKNAYQEATIVNWMTLTLWAHIADVAQKVGPGMSPSEIVKELCSLSYPAISARGKSKLGFPRVWQGFAFGVLGLREPSSAVIFDGFVY
ncbi:hypothetical protein BDQ17DRAFT_1337197 [Cyathus striatus]|nr:hypothetical protein BDQ17DRAFT_1337197 [Cyathus striatus]